MSDVVEKPKPQTFTVTRDDLRSIVHRTWAAGNKAKVVQSIWAKGQGAQEVLRDVLARLEKQGQ